MSNVALAVPGRIAVCVATYARGPALERLLKSLAGLEVPPGYALELRLVDNDASGSARTVFEALRASLEGVFERTTYRVEPRQNIAHARNCAIDLGPANLIATIDDDEVAFPGWLTELCKSLEATEADAVFGPVEGRLPDRSSRWLERGGFFHKDSGPDGCPLDWTGTRTSNTLIRGEWFYQEGLRFDPAYGRSGGSDADLFKRMEQTGARYASAARAGVWEDVEEERASLAWLLRRHYRHGLTFQRMASTSSTWRRFVWRSLRGGAHFSLGLLPLLVGRPERCARGLCLLALACGGLTASLRPAKGSQFVEYHTRTGGEITRRSA